MSAPSVRPQKNRWGHCWCERCEHGFAKSSDGFFEAHFTPDGACLTARALFLSGWRVSPALLWQRPHPVLGTSGTLPECTADARLGPKAYERQLRAALEHPNATTQARLLADAHRRYGDWMEMFLPRSHWSRDVFRKELEAEEIVREAELAEPGDWDLLLDRFDALPHANRRTLSKEARSILR